MGGTQSAHEAMARGPKKHLKRLNAPKHWMLDKMGGVWAPRPSTGPHKLRECLPLILILRNRLKYALTKKEVQQILMQRLIKVDGKVRTDPNYPCGFMDVISIDKTDEHFRMLYDAKGRFVVHRLNHKNFSFCGTVSSTPSPRRKFNRSSCSVSSKLMARYAPTPTTPVASWMLFPLTRPTSTSACSTMPRAVSSCTG